ncbi:hypothetical protein [Teredinibacter turnerae]|uniref:Lipoprotein n=1 Tax=Teredinibacter turnerae (strain ATCC 39867 / T7901) TaxID=377629 RepID=C5BLU1_TERTT|nr:hypothetical protein [Teredinibacter turnerae]ACR13384.1 conserved hypothetical protein [Teredinibacter turnerae T7901]
MRHIAAIIICSLIPFVSFAESCNEQCKREKAEAKRTEKFPSYLSWKFCEDTRFDFMTTAVASLDKYRTHHFDTRYKGGMRNIKGFVEQRKEWLQECDDYLASTRDERIFEDEKTTNAIFSAMDDISTEMNELLAGAQNTQDSSQVINSRFETLLKRVDDHKTLMLLKGRFVTR